jgi:hypothetical protein
MVEKLSGTEMLLTPEESDLFERQAQAQASGSVTKADAKYQNDPKGDEQCSKCERFVPGFPDDIAGYCTKVRSFRGPQGMIFDDGWCKFFEQATEEEDS